MAVKGSGTKPCTIIAPAWNEGQLSQLNKYPFKKALQLYNTRRYRAKISTGGGT